MDADDDTALALDAKLPLTCSRSGTCCHGKAIWLNPWEVARLATGRGIPARDFRRHFTVDGGIRLRVDGPPGWLKLPACSQYDPASGCSVHAHRPLACRLYPLGRRRQGGAVGYIHEGRDFPCLFGCPEVQDLPRLTVADYLAGQQVTAGEQAQDAYLEVMQDLAEGALVLLLDSGLAASGDREVLPRWSRIAALDHEGRAASLPADWFDALTIPDGLACDDAAAYVQTHRERMQGKAQAAFGAAGTPAALRDASVLMMTLSLHLGAALGIQVTQLVERWTAIARQHGAQG
jgi:Fe-S-cluster containining protein